MLSFGWIRNTTSSILLFNEVMHVLSIIFQYKIRGMINMTKVSDPINFAGLHVKNRISMAPMATNFASDTCEVTDRLCNYYEQRSKGQVGLIIVEGTSIKYEPRAKNGLAIHDDRFIPGLKKLATQIKSHGATAVIQITHDGGKTRNAERLVGPSAVSILDGPLPEPLTIEEIETIKDSFVDATRRAQAAGFDGVELHGAHLYLLSAFLSSYTNQRTDAYGGTTEKKTKLIVDIIKGIRNELGSYPVIVRINGIENYIRGITITEAKQIAQILEGAGADALHISAVSNPYYNSEELALYTAENYPSFLEAGQYFSCAAAIKEVVNIPVIGVGGVKDAVFAARVVEEGLCDIVAIGRNLIADPLIAEKTLSGSGEPIIECDGAGLCHKRLGQGRPIECKQNKNL